MVMCSRWPVETKKTTLTARGSKYHRVDAIEVPAVADEGELQPFSCDRCDIFSGGVNRNLSPVNETLVTPYVSFARRTILPNSGAGKNLAAV